MARTDVGASHAASEVIRAATIARITLPARAAERLATYIETLLLWRLRLSLTAASTASEIIEHHIADAFPLVRFIRSGNRVADLGSGAGFPGMPLAIICPEAQFHLIESRRKRANFLREVIRVTGVANVVVVEDRAEEIVQQNPGAYDVAVSRAVWRGSEFWTISTELLRLGGMAIAMKGPAGGSGGDPDPRFSQVESVPYQLAGGTRRTLLIRRRVA